MFKVYTEGFANVPEIVSRYFDGFTIIDAKGYWKGKAESAVVIDLVTKDEPKVRRLVQAILQENDQEAVLVVQSHTTNEFVTSKKSASEKFPLMTLAEHREMFPK